MRLLTLLPVSALLAVFAVGPLSAQTLPGVTWDEVVPLSVDWAFQSGDDMLWAEPGYDDSRWSRTTVPIPFAQRSANSNMMWMRLTLATRPRLDAIEPTAATPDVGPLGITLGKINSAYQVYAGGILLGGVGQLPPRQRIDYDRHRVYAIPAEAFDSEGHLTLALRIWRSSEIPFAIGPTEGPFLVGPYGELVHRETTSELLPLFFACLFLILGIAHLELFRRQPNQPGYLWFALMAFTFGTFGLLRTQWKYALAGADFVFLKEMEYGLAYTMIAVFIQLLASILQRPLGLWERALQVFNLAGLMAVLTVPGLWLNLKLLPYWQAGVLLTVLLTIGVIVVELRRGNPEAKVLVVGAIAFGASFLHDVAVGEGLITGGRWTGLGFTCFVLSLAVALAGRIGRLHKDIEELRSSQESASRANQAKTEFLANMSHEIRTPMAGILGATELLLKDELSSAHREKVGIIRSSAVSLLTIIDDILDFSKVESGRLDLEEEDFPLRPTVLGVTELLAHRARSQGLELRLDYSPNLPPNLCGDALRLRQVLLNLVANALKFTERGQVRLKVEHAGRIDGKLRIRFSVEDTGIGMPAEVVAQLFRPFTQADSSTTRRFGGTGLGLAISQRLVQLMGGEIQVESKVGEGSTFSFVGLFSPAKVRRVSLPALRPVTSPVAPPRAAPRRPRDTPRHVLVAEDNPVTRILVEHQLEDLGYRTTCAGDGLEVLASLEEQSFDAILMDCQMPHLDGYETTRRLRLREIGGQHVPVIAITAHALEGERRKCLEAGMDDYLSKPFTQEQLATVLERWTEGAAATHTDRGPTTAVSRAPETFGEPKKTT